MPVHFKQLGRPATGKVLPTSGANTPIGVPTVSGCSGAPWRAHSGTMAGPMRSEHLIVMNNLLNIIIVLLVVGWLIGYIGFGSMVGSLIHVLLVLALIGLVYRLFSGRKGPL